jgi:hypothetical protein
MARDSEHGESTGNITIHWAKDSQQDGRKVYAVFHACHWKQAGTLSQWFAFPRNWRLVA